MAITSEYDPTAGSNRRTRTVKEFVWRGINATLFRFSPFFCHGWRRLLLRCFGASIPDTATVARSVVINQPWNLFMGEKSMIGAHSWVMCFAPVRIGARVVISEYVKILTGSHETNAPDFKPIWSGIEISDDCWIAVGATLASGGHRRLKVGRGAVIAAGSVVFSNVLSNAVMIGNPAAQLTTRVVVGR